MEWYPISDLSNAYTDSDVHAWADDGKDEAAIITVLEWSRHKSVEFVKSQIAPRYDPDQWDVDSDNDGYADAVPGILIDCAIKINLHKLASRRPDIPQSIIDNMLQARQDLISIANGLIQLDGDTSTAVTRTIAGNMYESDLGELTQKDSTEDLPWSGYQ